MWNAETPAITTMLRGMVYIEATIEGPAHDLHSDVRRRVENPANVTARIVAAMHEPCGAVAAAGFYDGVEDPPTTVLERWRTLGFDESGFLASGIEAATAGETGRSILERTWSRPTLDVNGMFGGYTGAGEDDIPSRCSVKISCRLVPGQDPAAIETALQSFIRDRLPEGFSVEFLSHGSNPAVVPADSPWLAAATRGLARAYETPAAIIGTGGSIPAVGEIQDRLGIDALLVGFGLDDRVHSPNEKFDLQCYRGGIRVTRRC